ncbi:hybrid sensor histidine kinase/response regulator [Chelatococcus asaccharovorans]|uniref:histidine kinase n=1 Tax=Chelatococcus asaccharovorans TaxID=28210 RepID=A0A2V3U8R8_9HYPH|nr:ATP-binding protein [Chelatococcus asaccharovorans]MBS7705389.1 response regulator [Chelatococcus asaccharovorans]PXW60206.1 signal transduction histidine kinase [Chelatococcus asaccharovorans]
MSGRQRIDRVRREYNQWVTNQTLEDFALRFTAKRARRWSPLRVANTALGAISFLALEAIGAATTLSYGFTNVSLAILAVGTLIFLTGVPISYYASRYGVDIDLLTRGAGFGYIGSTITSLIYASFTFIFFAIEAVILAIAIEMMTGLPRALGYLVSALVVIPLVTHGITWISRFQLWTQPLWIVLQIAPFIAILHYEPDALSDWMGFTGRHGDLGGGFSLILFGAASSVMFSLVAQIGEQVDFLRFLPRERSGKRWAWWLALISAGPGWIIIGALKMLAGSFLAVYALKQGVTEEQAVEPAEMYVMAFETIFGDPRVALYIACAFVILCQLKINVTNAYAGSIAWSNFFSRLTHSHPGRVVWLVFNLGVAVLLMELGVYRALENTLALYSNVAIGWVGAIVADLVINKPLKLSPAHIEFKRAHLYDINPVGVGAMLVATTVGISTFFGLAGELAKALSPFLALGAALVTAPLIAWGTGGKYYLARTPKKSWQKRDSIKCCICEHAFEPEDMASCPAYAGPICSLCCSLDARCDDLCKPHARYPVQMRAALTRIMPARLHGWLTADVTYFLGVFFLAGGVIALTLTLIYLQSTSDPSVDPAIAAGLLWKAFFVLAIIIGVAAWLFVLVQASRTAAQEESRRQTALLMNEIEAHNRTDAALQRAKDAAEAANHAKSRYVVGLSHELRTPLNAIVGYAQILENDPAIAAKQRGQIHVVRRSADHLSGLIDGILDISKIEAGRLDLSRDEIPLVEFLDQIVGMFKLQAAAKGLEFRFDRPANLPSVVYADGNRLRQVLINLLSNAIKFTTKGKVTFALAYRSPVAEFTIADTGPGIPAEDLERIFEPFERGAGRPGQMPPGTGLGLTISKLLAGVMGGSITVTSKLGIGTAFKVKLLLSEVTDPRPIIGSEDHITGYVGRRRTIFVVDDDPVHHDLMREILGPLGFIILHATHGEACTDMARHVRPDLFLIDVSMAGMDGWALAQALREQGQDQARIVMFSASAVEAYRAAMARPFHDGYLLKPVEIRQLLREIQIQLGLEWDHGDDPLAALAAVPAGRSRLQSADVADLRRLGELGHIRGLQARLDVIGAANPTQRGTVAELTQLVDTIDLPGFMAALDAMDQHDA